MGGGGGSSTKKTTEIRKQTTVELGDITKGLTGRNTSNVLKTQLGTLESVNNATAGLAKQSVEALKQLNFAKQTDEITERREQTTLAKLATNVLDFSRDVIESEQQQDLVQAGLFRNVLQQQEQSRARTRGFFRDLFRTEQQEQEQQTQQTGILAGLLGQRQPPPAQPGPIPPTEVPPRGVSRGAGNFSLDSPVVQWILVGGAVVGILTAFGVVDIG